MSIFHNKSFGLLSLLILFAAAVLFAFPLPWPNTKFFVDTIVYADAVEAGRWVAHSPGYPLFVALGNLLNKFTGNSILAVQSASFSLYLAALLTVGIGLFRQLDSSRAIILLAACGLSFIPLFFSRIGTNHCADLFAAALLLLAIDIYRAADSKKTFGLILFCLAMLLSAGFRLPTFIMLAPVFTAFLLLNFHKKVIIAFALTACAVISLQLFTISQYGGWDEYRRLSAAASDVARQSSVLLSGITNQTIANMVRSLFWFVLATNFLLIPALLVLWNQRKKMLRGQVELIFPMLTILGPFLVNFFYLSTHPGYLAVTIPGMIWLVAHAMKAIKLPWLAIFSTLLSCAFSLAIFYGGQLIKKPESTPQAIANSLLLQYNRNSIEVGIWRPAAEWVTIAGNESLIPEERRELLDTYIKQRDEAGLLEK